MCANTNVYSYRLKVWTGEPPLDGMSVQVIRRGATDMTVALVQSVICTP